MTQDERHRQAEDRADEVRKHDPELRNARQVSDALIDTLQATSAVDGSLVELEKRFDRRADDLIDLVRAAKAVYERAAVELAEHVCEYVETHHPIREVA